MRGGGIIICEGADCFEGTTVGGAINFCIPEALCAEFMAGNEGGGRWSSSSSSSELLLLSSENEGIGGSVEAPRGAAFGVVWGDGVDSGVFVVLDLDVC